MRLPWLRCLKVTPWIELDQLFEGAASEAILGRFLGCGRFVTLEGPSMRTRHLDPVSGLSDQ